jgi:hypothetical protein
MRVAAMVSVNSFPLIDRTMAALVQLVDDIYIRFDVNNGDPELLQRIHQLTKGKLRGLAMSHSRFVPPGWREECLEMIHNSDVKPDIVLCPDEDEVFDDNMKDELEWFWRSDKDGMMFDYHPLETNDGRVVNGGMPYPPDPHMKAFKYKEGISYFPYQGDAKIAQYSRPKSWFKAKTKIRHYPAFTKAMQAAKHWRSDTPMGRGTKAVTLLGFGPSSKGKNEIIGEPWTMNNFWDVYDPETCRRVTRVFEMHKLGERSGGHWDKVRDWLAADPSTQGALKDGHLSKREDIVCANGVPYLHNFAELSKRGTRVIFQEPHPLVPDSEAYPLSEVEARLGLNYWAGTPCYMIAMAIMEGYNHIRIFGLDQSDFEHTIQRTCFAAWCMYAMGRGIKVDGYLSWLVNFNQKRYGYDYGPEGGPYQEKMMWFGHPMTTRYKMPSRAMMGDLCPKAGG